MKRMIYALPCLVMALFLLGCPTDVKDEATETEITEDETTEKEWVTVPLAVGESTKDDVIAYFGKQPEKYVWGEVTYTEDTLPESFYFMDYGSYQTGDRIGIVIDNYDGEHICDEIRILSDIYRCVNGIKMGLTSDAVFGILGDPDTTEFGVKRDEMSWNDNVFFENINGREGYHYYADAVSGIRLFFWEDEVSCVYLFDDTTAFEVFK